MRAVSLALAPMNSAALRFIPMDKLEAEGYGQYLPLFTKAKS